MGSVMLVKWLEARLEAAGVGDWPGLSRLVIAELALPVMVVPILTFVVAPHCHGLDRILVGATMLAILVNAATGVARKIHTAERLHRAEMGVTGALEAIDRASRATSAVLAVLRDQVTPALDKAFVGAVAMTKDRRLSASVRGRAAKIGKDGEGALSILRQIVEPPPVDAEVSEPEAAAAPALDAPPIVNLRAVAPLALAGPQSFEPAADDQPMPPQLVIGSTFRPVRPLRVLAAEHNGVHQLLLRTLLSQAGIEPEIVSVGAEAIEAWQREPWDLILLDMQMPDMDALGLARSFRAAESRLGWPYTPILAVSEKPTPRDLTAFAAAGMDGHVAKPIAAQTLLAAIEATIAAPAPMEMEMARVA